MSSRPKAPSKEGGPSVYLVIGENNQITREAIQSWVDGLLEPEARDFNFLTLDAERQGALEDIITAALLPPFWGSRKVVLVVNATELPSQEVKRLMDALPRVPATNVLILWSWKKGVVPRLGELVGKIGRVVEFEPTAPAAVLRWADAKAKGLGIRLDARAKRRMFELVGPNPDRILRELEKLAAYVRDEGTGNRGGAELPVRVEDVEALVGGTGEANVFRILDYIGSRNLKGALGELAEALRNRENPTKILSLIANHIRCILITKLMAESKRPLKEIRARLGRTGFRVHHYIRESRNFTQGELIRGLIRVSRIDREIKSGMLPPSYALERVIVELCGRAPDQNRS